MDAKHTPGPWHVETWSYEKSQTRPENEVFTIQTKADAIAQTLLLWRPDQTPHNRDEEEANARLIAAAPDLLTACEELMKAESMQQGSRSGGTMGQISTAIDIARAALAKARDQ